MRVAQFTTAVATCAQMADEDPRRDARAPGCNRTIDPPSLILAGNCGSCRTKMTDAIAIEGPGERGIIESIAGGPPKPVGFVDHCPVVYRVD